MILHTNKSPRGPFLNPKPPATTRTIKCYIQMHMKVVVTILLIAAVPVCAQAQNRSAGKVSKGNGVLSRCCTGSIHARCQRKRKILYGGRKTNARKTYRRLVDVSCRGANKV